MASYTVNQQAVARARQLIVSPMAPATRPKARYAFVYGDFRRVHRSGLLACQYRAAEWKHREVEQAAHDLLQYLDKRSG